MEPASQPDILHASCVCIDGKAVLIIGPSESGKSSLALQLISLGAALVADDRTVLRKEDGGLIASAPATILGRIEARGVGILTLKPAPPTPVHLVVDLGQQEEARLPEQHVFVHADVTFPCLWASAGPHFPASVLLYLRDHIGLRP